jgi:hypothetical protein
VERGEVQMAAEGKMHAWLRCTGQEGAGMAETPTDALRIVNSLNDRNEMDGRIPMDTWGCLTSAGCTTGWTERKIFGKVRT